MLFNNLTYSYRTVSTQHNMSLFTGEMIQVLQILHVIQGVFDTDSAPAHICSVMREDTRTLFMQTESKYNQGSILSLRVSAKRASRSRF